MPRDRAMGLGHFIRLLAPYFRPYPRLVATIVAVMLLDLGGDMFVRLGFKFLIDNAIIPGDRVMLLRLILALSAAAIASGAAAIASDTLYSRLGAQVVGDIRERVFRHLQGLSAQYFRKSQVGDLMARFSTDVSYVETAVYYGFGQGLAGLLGVTFAIVPLFVLAWPLALVVTALLPLALIGPLWIGPRASAASYAAKEGLGALQGAVAENLLSQDVIRAFRLQNWTLQHFRRLQADVLRASVRFNILSYLSDRLPTVLMSLVNLVILAVGAFEVFHGHLTIGTLMAFQVLFLGVVTQVQLLMSVTVYMLQATGGMRRVQEVLETAPTVQDTGTALLSRPEHAITLDHVTFDYGDGIDRLIDLSLRIPVGARVAIVGPSGSGKSTVLSLLLRFWDPVRGSVQFDGVPARTLTLDSLRAHIGIVFQDSMLFDTTIAENIRMGHLQASDAEVEQAARRAELHDYILRLPDGYQTRVGERGTSISGGQRQRIAIARAILGDPPLLLLDEATAALDPTTAAAVWRTMWQLGQSRTLVYVTHHVAQAAAADLIVVLDHGRCVEQGTHAELLAAHGLYASLVAEQGAGGLAGPAD